MYCPARFQEDNPLDLIKLIEQFPLATIIRHDAEGVTADHVPLMYQSSASDCGRLVGHVARNNPLWQVLPQQEVLVVFQGPSTYISPNWYASKQAEGKVVPTWNYAVVHAYCTLSAVHDSAGVLRIVTALTDQFEAAQQHPWKVSDAPAEFTDRLLESIVGVDLQIKRWQGKWKVSQNQPASNQQSVIDGLRKAGSEAQMQMSALVKSRGDK